MKPMMNQKHSTKRTIISFSIALAISLLSIYIQHYSETKAIDYKNLEAKVSPIESPTLLESLH